MPRENSVFVRILMLAGASFALLAAGPGQSAKDRAAALSPLDPQRVQDQDLMTWDDYRPIPGKNWADPALKPERGFKLAGRRDRFSEPALRHHPAQGIGPVRQSPDRSDRPRKGPPILRRLLHEAGRRQPRPDDQRLLDGAVARQVRHHRSRGLRPLPHAQAHLGLRPERIRPERRDARREQARGTDGAGLRRALDGRRRDRTSARTSTPSSACTRATTRRASGRSSAR